MSINIVLEGQPLSTGHLYKVACRGKFPTVYMTADGKKLKESYQWQAKSQYRRQKPLQRELEVWITLYFGTKRKSDWDNFHKISMDALSGIVWVDDVQIIESHVSKRYDKKNPRIEVEVREIE